MNYNNNNNNNIKEAERPNPPMSPDMNLMDSFRVSASIRFNHT